MSERSAQLAELQGMGFNAAACERALQVTNNSLHRAIDWLLSNPDEAARAASDATQAIFTMGFDESLVRRALQQAGGDEQHAIALILNGEVSEGAPSRDASPPPPPPVSAVQQPVTEHSGEFRRTSERPPVRVGPDGAVRGEISTYCSTSSREGTLCAHRSVGTIQADHWSCCGALLESDRHCRPPLSGDDRVIFSMGFPTDLVRRALRRTRDNEARAIELLLQGQVDADPAPEEEEPRAPRRRHSTCPPEWSGTVDEFNDAMQRSIQLYMSWCSGSRTGSVNPCRSHHERWLIQQLADCRAEFDAQAAADAPYDIVAHAAYVVTSFRRRHPGLRIRESHFGGVRLQIDRGNIVNSTVEAFKSVADEDMSSNFTISFQGQEGTDAGGLTDDWLSLFMQEALDPYRDPPLFLLPWQTEGETSCLRLNHSMQAFGISQEQQHLTMRAFGIVLGLCMKHGRYACNSYTLSKSLLQRLLRQELPPGILPLSEEFPDAFNLLRSLMQRREVWGASSLDQYLADAEKKYTAESKVADLMTLQQYLRDRIAVETELVGSCGCPDAVDPGRAGGDARTKAGSALLQSIVAVETVVKRIKNAFRQENMKLPPEERFPLPSGEEIRQKLRERSGAPAALAAGVAVPNPQTWHARRGALERLVEKRKKLLAKLDEARVNLLQMRVDESQRAGLDDNTLSALSGDVPPSSDLNTDNFDAYCADLVQKRLHNDVVPLIQSMRSGFNLVQPDDLALRQMDAATLQHKLFPLHPVTLQEFKSNAQVQASSNSEENQKLLWRVMAEDLSDDQVQNVFYFATNYHTLAGSDQRVKIVFERRDPRNLLPKASTCSWLLKLPDCMVQDDIAPDFPASRARMLAVLTWAASPEAQGYGFA